MFAIIGAVVVLSAVIGGYLLEHGNLNVLFQPAEVVIIFGAAVGGFIIASPMKVIKAVISGVLRILSGKAYSKADYMDVLLLLSEIFSKIRKEGLVSIEADVDNPHESKIFSNYSKFLKNHHAVALVADTLRTVMTTSIAPHELESLLDNELDAHHEELMIPSKSIANVAESLPGLGIVAAVLGVVITMGKINEPPEVLGHSIGAALVGTFMGVLMCYGFAGPVSKNLEYIANEEKEYMNVIKVGLVAFVGGAAPQIAVEFARRVIPGNVKPTFVEVEEAIRGLKK
ncbi:flagellar motor stator protein MotA [Dissulfurispira thermophila]|uniref:Flagellar motor stator protein MotA n=1 Tax=Dissulfurispira thermophila TaxID=2715679 RepID=A0A7G1H078_9BACT|nr:flagellar motor stator protein MotA [Dissulfurispira thermophila]BCB96094.1 flagellar motor stator protein MotA [Dissulfurispira thermophila]